MNWKIIFIVVFVLILLGGVGFYLYPRFFGGVPYTTAAVTRGNITHTVAASGDVETPTTVDLNFKAAGKLTAMNVKVGDKVTAGQLLAQQDSSQLGDQAAQMKAAIDNQQARLNQLLAGASPQAITAAKAAVDSALANEGNAQRSVDDARATLIDTLKDIYVKSNDAVLTDADQMFSNPQAERATTPQTIITMYDSLLRAKIDSERLALIDVLNSWQSTLANLSSDGDLSQYAQTAGENLDRIKTFFSDLSLAANNPNSCTIGNGNYCVPIPAAWKTAISTATATLEAETVALNNVQTALDSANSALRSAQAGVNTAQSQLKVVSAPARDSDIAVIQTQINQAQASLSQVLSQIQDLSLYSPIDGTVAVANGEVGEVATANTVIASILPTTALQVKVNVSEDNIVNVKTGQHVDIELDAFGSDSHFSGTVTQIDPQQTIVGGAVYYQTTVVFDQNYNGVLPGMTANVTITTASKNNVLMVPASAIQQVSGKYYVQLLRGKTAVQTPVQTGISGANNVEIVSGVAQGDSVITGNK